MRRSRRFSAIDAANRLFDNNKDESENSSSDSDVTSESSSESESELDTTDTATEWQIIQGECDQYEPEHIFISDTGMQNDSQPLATSVESFVGLFLTDELFNMLVSWTNIKAELELDQHDVEPCGDLPTSLANWRPVTTQEIKKVIGILICMQLNHKPELRNYWSRNVIYRSDFFNDPRCLPRNRFEEIMRYLRFCNYSELDNDDKLTKIRPFLSYVQQKCKRVYIPAKDICIDESLLLYKGRLLFRRYIPSKRARYGVLSYCLCESSTGYTWNIHIAAGNAENERFMTDLLEDAQVLPFSEKIVIALLSSLMDKGYHLFVDNYFSSVRLAQYLYQRKTLLTATIRPNRGVPQILKQQHVPVKSHAFARKSEVLLVKCVDRKSSGVKTIYLVDTAQKAGVQVRQRILRGGITENIEKSLSVLSYNKGMGGVDSRDGSLHPYNISRKSFKWFTKLSLHLCHIMIRNSWIIYCKSGGEFDFLSYQEKVIEILVLNTGNGRRAGSGGGRPLANSSASNIAHVPKRLSPRPNRPRPTKRCKVCYQEGVRKETVFVCAECPSSPGLCAFPCFGKHHS